VKRVVNSLNEALHQLMRSRSDVLIIGEDIIDPYGGAFKVTQGLSTGFPDRVITTPVSEAGIVGLATGLALRGYRPIVEIMFGDFVTLIADQLINHASIMPWVYNQQVELPLVVRTPMGGRRGYGPTHSQSLERLYMGVPGLAVVAISQIYDPGEILRVAAEDVGAPVLFIENKSLYTREVLSKEGIQRYNLIIEHDDSRFPTSVLYHDHAPDITFVAYGGMVPLVIEAVDHLNRREDLSCEIVVPHQLAPLDMDPIARSVQKTRRIVVVEEGVTNWGWGAEVVAGLAHLSYEAPPERIGAKPLPIPAGRVLEDQVLPQVEDIIKAAIRTVERAFI
jgi:pyruvate/2-oxoglutarate/acetoin dehydrogenase E1 component